MSVFARFEEKHAFVLRPIDLRNTWEALQKRVQAVQAEASCSDSIERTFLSLEDLLRYENPRSRAIVRLTFNALSTDGETRVNVSFGGRYAPSIEASATGPEESVVAVKNALGEIADGVRPWFAPLARIDFFYIIMGIFGFAFVVLSIMAGTSSVSKPVEIGIAVKAALGIVGFFVALIAAIWGLNRLRQRYFPVATFATGQGESRYHVDEKIRWVVIVGFLISLFSSLVATFLWGAA